MFWNGLSAAKERKTLNPQEKLRWQIQTLSFLLLLESESDTPASKASVYTQDAITSFESSCGAVTKEDASFLLQEVQTLFNRTSAGGQTCGEEAKLRLVTRFYVLSEIVLLSVKSVCKAGHHGLAYPFLDEAEAKISKYVGFQWIPLVLGKWGVKIHSAKKANKDCRQALTECARSLRSLSAGLGFREGHAVAEGCNLVVWAVDSGHSKELSGAELLALYSFLEEYQIRIRDMLYVVSIRFNYLFSNYLKKKKTFV